MPIYEFKCGSCEESFEKIMRHSDPVPPCPECAGVAERQISAASFVLKGGGWENDGYGNGSPKPRLGESAATAQIPYVARDGSVMHANGTKMLNPDGSKA